MGKAQLTCRIAVEVEAEAGQGVQGNGQSWKVTDEASWWRGAKEGRPIGTGGGRICLFIMCSDSSSPHDGARLISLHVNVCVQQDLGPLH